MEIFNLPDLGEGLLDAEINEWFVKEGDTVKADQTIVSMETAKAVVDVPSPQDGVIKKLYGSKGDIIKTGTPLVAFIHEPTGTADKGTVVGHIEEATSSSSDDFIVGSARQSRPKATTTVKLLAKKLNIDLKSITGTGENNFITKEDVEKAAKPAPGFESIRGVRRTMVSSMSQSHQQVVPVSIYDDADINSWLANTDITVRLIDAIAYGCEQEPALNAWFDGVHCARKLFTKINLGIAMDSDDGLFVPVIHDVKKCTNAELRQTINDYKKSVKTRSIAPVNLQNATITLSNFGKFAGRYASPIIVPPTVAILAVGRIYQGAVSCADKVESHTLLPLSLTFDHRAVTGGEATRFLGAVMEKLQNKN